MYGSIDTSVAVAFLVAIVLGTASCDWFGGFATGTATSVESTAVDRSGNSNAPPVHYSSFGVRIDARHFGLISFKDVGLGRANPSPSDRMLEAIAQSLAYELQLRDDLEVHPRVVYDESLSDPAAHTYCEKERLYVDLWRSGSPDRWGYSLWSGCSASMKFASDEIPVSPDPETAEIEDAVQPLTSSIARSFADAVENGCYRRAC